MISSGIDINVVLVAPAIFLEQSARIGLDRPEWGDCFQRLSEQTDAAGSELPPALKTATNLPPTQRIVARIGQHPAAH